MRDQWNRTIRYARISVTNDCNLCCRYCRGAGGTAKVKQDTKAAHDSKRHGSVKAEQELAGPSAGPLTETEFRRICGLLGDCGITRFKLTGGEPLLRKDFRELAEWLAGQDFAEEVTVTSNGTLLAEQAPALRKAGLSGVNVSLDTLQREVFRRLTGRDCLEEVLAGIRQALAAGLRVRINTVAAEGRTEKELAAFWELIRELPVDVRFISLMPVGPAQTGPRGLPGAVIRGLYAGMGAELAPAPGRTGNGPAAYYRVADCKGGFGFIDPLHEKFCGSCNRIRIGADGSLKPCLYDRKSLDIRGLLQAGASREEQLREIQKEIYGKPLCHHFEDPDARQDLRSMDRIGG